MATHVVKLLGRCGEFLKGTTKADMVTTQMVKKSFPKKII